MVRGSGATVSTTWQGLHKKSSFSDCFFVIATHWIWNHLRHFEHPTQRNSAAGFTTSLSGAELVDSSAGQFFRATDLWLQALNTTRDTMLILRGETKQPKTRKGTNKRMPGCDVLSAQVPRQTNKTASEMLSSCLKFKSSSSLKLFNKPITTIRLVAYFKHIFKPLFSAGCKIGFSLIIQFGRPTV